MTKLITFRIERIDLLIALRVGQNHADLEYLLELVKIRLLDVAENQGKTEFEDPEAFVLRDYVTTSVAVDIFTRTDRERVFDARDFTHISSLFLRRRYGQLKSPTVLPT